MSTDLIAGAIGFLLTLMIFSYLIGDNALFRVAVYVFVGVSAGYVASVAWWQVLWPDLLYPLATGSAFRRAELAVPLLLSGLLLMKTWPSLARLGAPAMGLLVGAASAAAIGGAVQGTLLPQMLATINAFDLQPLAAPDALANAVLVLVGVATSLAFFHFSARRRSDGSVARFGLLEMIAAIGGIFLAITLGVLFAGVYSAALTAMIERLHFLGAFMGVG
jgi:hypothetical protein